MQLQCSALTRMSCTTTSSPLSGTVNLIDGIKVEYKQVANVRPGLKSISRALHIIRAICPSCAAISG